MPYTVDLDPRLFRATLSGEITLADLRAIGAEVMAAEALLSRLPDRLICIEEGARWSLNSDAMMAFVEMRTGKQFPNQFKSAVVATTPLNFGFARMFQTLNQHPQITIQVFETEAAALAWLAEG